MIKYSELSMINTLINNAIVAYDRGLNVSMPVEIIKYNEDMTVNVKSLVQDKCEYINMQMINVPGIAYNPQNVKYGLLMPIDYAYNELLQKGTLTTPFKLNMNNYGYIVPILVKDNVDVYKQNKDYDVTLYNKDNSNKIIVDDSIQIQGTQISLSGKQPLDIKTDSATLKDLITGIIESLTLAATGTGNQGAPIIPNPQLQAKIVELQQQLQMLLK